MINECTDLGVRNVFLYIVEMIAQGNLEYCFVQAVDRFQKYSSDPGILKRERIEVRISNVLYGIIPKVPTSGI